MIHQKFNASDLALDINSMIRACILACDPHSKPDEWNGDDGIERTLEVADRMMGDLIDRIERLELAAAEATQKEGPTK